MGETYTKAGVSLESGARATRLIGELARTTLRPEVLSGVGPFGGLFQLGRYQAPVLVSSVDGVGTKLIIARTLDRYDTVGVDIVNHCVNDIFTCGAEPLFFLDYIGTGRLVPERVAAIVAGLAEACREVGCALIGGETAEMPDVYGGDDYDLVGSIVGVVEKADIIDGKTIAAGDVIIGLASSGLHTNGYSLVRKIFSPDRLNDYHTEPGRTLGEALLEPHRCYYHQLKPLLSLIKGMAHVTGGGLIDNVPRVLPEGTAAHFKASSWEIPPIFKLIQREGKVAEAEMYHVFNMGIGMVVICSPENADQLTGQLPEAKVIGEVVRQKGAARVVVR
jgi:phosphoribosylformylglycinamidine cyclo-ligase